MHFTSKLIQFLGSPFADCRPGEMDLSSEERKILYDLAYRNKVRLYYMEVLRNSGQLGSFEEQYAADMDRYQETFQTAVNLSARIQEVSDRFAIFKFLKPYPHTPSDVDVLIFGDPDEFTRICRYLVEHGYYQIGSSPSQTVLYDLRGGLENMDARTVGGKKGGKYYIDVYSDVSASHLVYLNKESIERYRIHHQEGSSSLQTLHAVADLPVILTHSIIPELLFTLADFYTTLHYIHGMNETELRQVAQILQVNNLTRAGFYSLGLTERLHQEVFGFVPEKIELLRKAVARPGWTSDLFNGTRPELPYHYPTLPVAQIFLERFRNPQGRRSMLRQGIATLDPRMLRWVVYNIILRKTRDTY